jgi:hypothetical protein
VPKQRKRKAHKARISEDHQDAILVYASKLMATMGLPTYQILIMKKPASKGAAAEIRCVDDRYVAQLYLSKDWESLSEDEQRQTITHEVLHLWERQLSDWFYSEVHDVVNVHDFLRLERQFRHVCELMIDNVALILADTHRLKEEWEEAHGDQPLTVDQILEGATVD